jgi:Rod binding domain-containing protein
MSPKAGKSDDPAKIRDAAQQFEGLLIAQVLQSAHDDGGWLGSGEDSAGSCASGFAEQQLAVTMAKNGGFGLAAMISKGLENGR